MQLPGVCKGQKSLRLWRTKGQIRFAEWFPWFVFCHTWDWCGKWMMHTWQVIHLFSLYFQNINVISFWYLFAAVFVPVIASGLFAIKFEHILAFTVSNSDSMAPWLPNGGLNNSWPKEFGGVCGCFFLLSSSFRLPLPPPLVSDALQKSSLKQKQKP